MLMRRTALRLLVALITFFAGVAAATLLGGLFGAGAPERRFREVRIERDVRGEGGRRTYGCQFPRDLGEWPAPPPSFEVPAPPTPPPGVSPVVSSRVVIRRADGTVQVVESGGVRGR